MKREEHTHTIKQLAAQAGFSFCGISKAGFLAEEAPRLENWLNQNMHGKMQYMENHFDKRLDPTKLVEGAKSVISLLYNYHTPQKQTQPNVPKIATHAYGHDYHTVIKEKLKTLVEQIQQVTGNFLFRVFVDSAPVLDKAWAKKSGLGWVGKNSNLINKQMGSFFFIAEIICDLDLVYDMAIKDYCGTCTACIDACPTHAIVSPYVVDGSKCIAYLTIELKDEVLPNQFKGKMDEWAFGCDVCQDVCPWNRFAVPHNEPAFVSSTKMMNMSKQEWTELTEEIFQELFKHTPLQRTKYKGLKRNIDFIA